MSFIGGGDLVNISPPNLPPSWTGTPNPSWVAGVGGTYALDDDTFEPDSDPLTYTLNAGSAALPTGVTMSAAGVLTATAALAEGTTTGILVDIDDGTNPVVTSPAFSIVGSAVLTDQALRDLGYLLVDDYAGVDPTGVADSVTGINLAMIDGVNMEKPVWFSVGGVYRVSDTVRCGMWGNGQELQVYGGGDGASRAKIVLDDAAANFASGERPVVCWRQFTHVDAPDDVWPSNPMDNSGIWRGGTPVLFSSRWHNIDIDCGNNPGAFGMYFPAAQECFCTSIDIDCSQAAGGWWGLLGRNSPIHNVTITGGVWQIRNNGRSGESTAGSCLAGLTLIGDSRTTTPIDTTDFVPLTIVGFDLTRTTSGSFVTNGGGGTGFGCVVLVDGIINSAGGVVVDNSPGKALYMRNVYISGTDDIVQSAGLSTVTAAGTWKRVNEYVYNNVDPLDAINGDYPSQSLIDGTISAAEEPATDIDPSVAAPVRDYVADHTIVVPRVDSGAFENIDDHGATPNPEGLDNLFSNGNDSTADSLAALNAAVTAAKTAGHNRVVVPRNTYYTSAPWVPDKDSIIIGVGELFSRIAPRATWQPTSQVWVIDWPDDSTGAGHFSNVGIYTRTKDGTGGGATPFQFDWFSFMRWRIGKNSSSIHMGNKREFQPPGDACNPKDYYTFSGGGGGRHYGLTDCSGRNFGHVNCRAIKITNTSQPLHIYGFNVEISKAGAPDADINVEIQNSSNIRMFNSKREGDAATTLINDCSNVGIFGCGRQETSVNLSYVHRVEGTSDGIVIGISNVDRDNFSPTTDGNPIEAKDGEAVVKINFPTGCSIYRRGTPNDAAML